MINRNSRHFIHIVTFVVSTKLISNYSAQLWTCASVMFLSVNVLKQEGYFPPNLLTAFRNTWLITWSASCVVAWASPGTLMWRFVLVVDTIRWTEILLLAGQTSIHRYINFTCRSKTIRHYIRLRHGSFKYMTVQFLSSWTRMINMHAMVDHAFMHIRPENPSTVNFSLLWKLHETSVLCLIATQTHSNWSSWLEEFLTWVPHSHTNFYGVRSELKHQMPGICVWDMYQKNSKFRLVLN